MDQFVEFAARVVAVIQRAYRKKWSFLTLFVLFFFTSVLALAWLDLLPDAPSAAIRNSVLGVQDDLTKSSANAIAAAIPAPPVVESPVRLEIPSLRMKVVVSNPETADVATLDALLLKGAVRYPTSAKLGEEGNVVLFGHSSYLPVVFNPAYKTFDGIQKLLRGDTVIVYSGARVYTYTVRTVTKMSANDGMIPLEVWGSVLTLATCNSFGQKTDRFVVTADLVESHSLGA